MAALIGLLAVGAALAAGHLVGGLINPASSPYLAVGNAVVRLSPPALTEFAKDTFGTSDKTVLLSGVLVVLAVVAVAAGLASRRRERPGVVVVVVLGALGAAAVLASPAFTLLDLVAPAAAVAAGLGTFSGLHALARRAAMAGGPVGGAGPAQGDGGSPTADRPAAAGPSPAGGLRPPPVRPPMVRSRRSGADGPDADGPDADGPRAAGRPGVDPPGVDQPAAGQPAAGPPAAGPRAAAGAPGGARPAAGEAADAVSRRRVLAGASVAVGLASLAAAGAGQALARGAGTSRAAVAARLRGVTVAKRAPAVGQGAAFPAAGTPTYVTSNADFYRIDTALRIPTPDPATWRLRVHGMVERELSLSFDDLLARPLVERLVTLTCVSNPVGGNLISTAAFLGVDLRAVLLEAGVSPRANSIFSTSADNWYTATPTSVLLEPDRGALLAVGMNGEPLPPEHGFPVRMVVPGLYGYVSATKWLVDIEATTFDAPGRQGFWFERGWAQQAPIKTESRIDAPRPFGHVPAGTVTVAGIAWAQHTGIAAVEARADGGPWQRAQLGDEVSVDAWRMWRTTFALAPGSHGVEVRAIDRRGVVQTEETADPIPNGASGWPSVTFIVDQGPVSGAS